jgi:hypothetical protein
VKLSEWNIKNHLKIRIFKPEFCTNDKKCMKTNYRMTKDNYMFINIHWNRLRYKVASIFIATAEQWMMVRRFLLCTCQSKKKICITRRTLLSFVYQLQQSYAACARISFSNPRSQHLGLILSRENITWEIWKNLGNQLSHIWWEWNNFRLPTAFLLLQASATPLQWSVWKCWCNTPTVVCVKVLVATEG